MVDTSRELGEVSERATNSDQAAYWNGEAARHWLAYEQRYDKMLHPFTLRLIDAIRAAAPRAVLDVGCGCGATTLAAGRLVRMEGTALGIDLSAPLIERARLRAEAEGRPWVHFERRDAQHHPFEAERFDAVISRFGLMFFSDPVAGFSNVLQALRPGGRLAFVCWQDALSNEWMTVPGAVLLSYAGPVDFGPAEAPGPFALADHERVAETLIAAGFVDVTVEPLHEPLLLGDEPEETVEFLKDAGPGRRLLDGLDSEAIEACTAALIETLRTHRSDAGIRLGSAAWLVVAHRPERRS
jgi:SAM-dependent methyltransferase